jgi:hypothetical protein
MGDLLPSIIKSIRQETTEREAVAALKGRCNFATMCGLC